MMPVMILRGNSFYWVPVAFGIGIITYFKLNSEPTFVYSAIAIFVFSLLATLYQNANITSSKQFFIKKTVIYIFIAVLGFSQAQIRSQSQETVFLKSPIDRARITGRITSSEILQNGARLTLDKVDIQGLGRSQTPLMARIKIRTLKTNYQAGDWVSMTARLSPPSEPVVPGAFDFQFNAYFKNIGAYGFSYGDITKKKPARTVIGFSLFRQKLDNLRNNISTSITSALPNASGTIATALITGKRGSIAQNITEAMRNSGLAHLLAISGLHMGLITGFIYFLSRGFLALIPRVSLYYPTKKWAAAIALPGALTYALISGASVPTIRSFIMTALVLIAVILDRRGISLRSVAWAALIVLVFRPESIMGPSFQMSFSAVVVLIAGYEWIRTKPNDQLTTQKNRINKPLKYLSGVLITSFLAGLATAPFAIYHFNQLATYSVIANAIAVPISAFWVMPWALIGVLTIPFGVDGMAFQLMGWGIDVIINISITVSSWPGAIARFQVLPDLALGLIVFGTLIIILYRHPARYMGTGGLIAGLVIAFTYQPPDIIIGKNGKLTALYTSTGQIMLSNRRASKFKSRQWLKRYALFTDTEKWPKPGQESPDNQFRCDVMGCILQRNQKIISIIQNQTAFTEDCNIADVIIITTVISTNCKGKKPATVIDKNDLQQGGTHALWLNSDTIIIRNVNDARGNRPWVIQPQPNVQTSR